MNLDAGFYGHAKTSQLPLHSLKSKSGGVMELGVIGEVDSLLWALGIYGCMLVEKSLLFNAAGIYKGQRVFKIELLGVT